MPWKVGRHKSCAPNKPFAVLKEADGSLVACHATKDKATAQVRALYATAQEAIRYDTPVTSRVHEVVSTAAEAIFSNSDDGKQARAEIVIIRPGQNKSTGASRRFYTQEAIASAVRSGFWAGAPMFVDHGADKAMPKKRSARDLVAGISDKPGEVWLGQEGEARAMVNFFNPEFAAFAERAGSHLGISNNADIKGRRFRDMASRELNTQVDEFTERHSVDWVAFPSAGGGVAQFLATESEEHMELDWSALTPEMLAEHRPDLVTTIQTTARETVEEPPEPEPLPEPEPVPPAGLTRDEVQAMIGTARESWEQEDIKKAATRKQVADKLATAGLRPKASATIAARFDGTVEYVEATVQEAIDEMKEILNERGQGGPQPTEFGSGSGSTSGTAQESMSSTSPALAAMLRAAKIDPDKAVVSKEN